MEYETLLLLPQEPATFPCFQSDEHSLCRPVSLLQGRLKYHNLSYAKDFQVMCYLKFFPPKLSTGQLGPLLIWTAKTFDNFFKVFALVAYVEKLNLLKFEHCRFTRFRDIGNKVLTALSNAYRAKLFRKRYLHVGLS
jgi:hypothetical protein